MTPSNGPIFIVGANRSGTTLLRLILNAHSRIAIPEELNYLSSFLATVPIEKWRAPSLPPERFASFVDDCVSSWSSLLPELDRTSLRRQILDGPTTFRHPYETVLRTWADHHGKARWGEKTPGNLFYADIIYDMFPDAKFILVVRDPRAGVASMQQVDFFPNDPIFNAFSRRKHMTKGRSVLERTVPANQRCIVRYEDLVTAPEETTRTVCAFLGEVFEPGMLTFHRDAHEYMKDTAARSFNAQATRPISTSRLTSWRTHLRPDAIAAVERICRAEMEEFGYEPDGAQLRLHTAVEILLKYVYWVCQDRRFRHVRNYTIKHPPFAALRERVASMMRRLPSLP